MHADGSRYAVIFMDNFMTLWSYFAWAAMCQIPIICSWVGFSEGLKTLIANSPRRFRRPRLLLSRILSSPFMSQSTIPGPNDLNTRQPRVKTNHNSLRLLR